MQKQWTLLMLLCCIASLSAQEQDIPKERFNWGFRVGVNAPFVDIRSAKINDTPIELPSANSKIGFLASAFGRVNIQQHYLQLEAGINYLRSDIELQPEDFIPTLQPSNIKSSIINRIYTLDIPLLYGYNFVKQGPYELAFFTGPKFKYILKENNHIDNYDIRYAITTDESLKPFTVNYLIGVGVSISRLTLDFRYEFALTNIHSSGGYTLNSPDVAPTSNKLSIKRGINLLSFSLGFVL